jgi:flagella basal body P-ring formation protein FlgA
MNFLSLILSFLLLSASGPVAEETRDKVLELALQEISKQYDPEAYRFELKARWIPGSLLRSGEENVIRVRQNGPLSTYTNFEVRYHHNGEQQRADIQLMVTMQQWLPVTAVRLEGGHSMKQEDLIWRWVEVVPGRDDPVEDLREITGSVLRRTILAHQPLSSDYLSAPLMVEAGEEVTLLYDSNGIGISVLCESRQDGSLNEEITVFCKETRRKYLALVTGRGEASWLKTQ